MANKDDYQYNFKKPDTITELGIKENGEYVTKDIGVTLGNITGIQSVVGLDQPNLKFLAADGRWKELTILPVEGANGFVLENGKIPANYLPSYVDDIVEGTYDGEDFYDKYGAPLEGEPAKLYLSLDNNDLFRWTPNGGFIRIDSGDVELSLKRIEMKVKGAVQDAINAQTQSGNAIIIANGANSTAQTAQITANNAVTNANIAAEAATEAQTSAAEAVSVASNAQTSADNAAETASNAQLKATQAAETASNANTKATQAAETAATAQTSADNAVSVASSAQTSADNATSAASTANTKATQAAEAASNAQTSADNAASVASSAQLKADQAAEAASNAQISADNAATAAGNAQSSANAAAEAAAVADEKAVAAGNAASAASTAASNAQSSANAAANAASIADGKAVAAGNSAAAAKTAADNAGEYASRALGNLSTVQSVAETLAWITAHGTMALTSDTALDPTHVYFVRDANGDYTVGNYKYSVVSEPDVSQLSNYYVLSIDESLNNYVATHLAVDGEGLWIIPDVNGFKVLIATGSGSAYTTAGTYIVGGNGETIGEFSTNAITLGSRATGTTVGTGSRVFGVQCEASGAYSYAEGYKTRATGEYSHAEGRKAQFAVSPNELLASGKGAHAEGENTEALGQASHAEGRQGTASGECSHVEGYKSTASGRYAHAEGSQTVAGPNQYAHAEGESTVASGRSSHAEGADTTATQQGAHAEGFGADATNTAAHAEGRGTLASGYVSHAGGAFTVAAYGYQTVIGKYNNNKSDNLFEIGNGTADNARSNAFEVTSDGTVHGGTYTTTGADYAEMFEWEDNNLNNEDRVGRFVKLNGTKINFAENNEDDILGIVSGNPSICGNANMSHWSKMYLTDIYGRYIYDEEEKEHIIYDDEGNEITEKYIEKTLKVNPDYDSSQKYISRAERPEWDFVGLLGKLVVIDDGTSEVNGYVKPTTGGIATKSTSKTKFRVLERMDETHIRVLIL